MAKKKSNWKQYKALLDWFGPSYSNMGREIYLRGWFGDMDISYALKELVALALCKAKWHPEGAGGSADWCALCHLRDSLKNQCADCILTAETGCPDGKSPAKNHCLSNICQEICAAFDVPFVLDENGHHQNKRQQKKVQQKVYNLLSDLYRVKYNAYFGTNY